MNLRYNHVLKYVHIPHYQHNYTELNEFK